MAILLNAFPSIVNPQFPLVVFANNAPDKLITFAKNFFHFSQRVFVCLYGTKELVLDNVKDLSKVKSDITHADRVNLSVNKIFVKQDVFIGPLKFNMTHGSLYVVSGLTGVAAAVLKFAALSLNTLVPVLEVAGNISFGLGSMVALMHNIKILHAVSKIPADAPIHEKEAANMLKKSALMGIISSLNYILAAALLMLGAAATVALFFGCIAVFTGCLKIFYDYIHFSNAR